MSIPSQALPLAALSRSRSGLTVSQALPPASTCASGASAVCDRCRMRRRSNSGPSPGPAGGRQPGWGDGGGGVGVGLGATGPVGRAEPSGGLPRAEAPASADRHMLLQTARFSRQHLGCAGDAAPRRAHQQPSPAAGALCPLSCGWQRSTCPRGSAPAAAVALLGGGLKTGQGPRRPGQHGTCWRVQLGGARMKQAGQG